MSGIAFSLNTAGKPVSRAGKRATSSQSVFGEESDETRAQKKRKKAILGIDGEGSLVGDASESKDKDENEEEKEIIIPLPEHIRKRRENSDNVVSGLMDRAEKYKELRITDDEGAKFHADMRSLPEAPTLADYSTVRWDQIGSAMIKGMLRSGESEPFENKSSRIAKPIVYVPRPMLLGLGADPRQSKKAQQKKKYIAPGESREHKFYTTKTGKSYRAIDEELVEVKFGISKGDLVVFTRGPHKSLKATVQSVDKARGKARVCLVLNKEEMKVNLEDIAEIDNSMGRSGKGRDEISNRERHANSEVGDGRGAKNDVLRAWTPFPSMMIRIKSRSLSKGRYYNRKGVVTDLIRDGILLVQVDGSRSVLELKRRQCEPYLDSRRTQVIVVDGDQKGRKGMIVGTGSREAGSFSVKLSGSSAIISLNQSQLSTLA